MSDITDSIVLRCICGAKLKLKPAAAGKKVRCPKCQTVLTAPAAPDPAETYELRQEEPDPEPDLLAGLQSAAAATVSAPPIAPAAPPRTKDCPKCQAPMNQAAVLCTSCGYNVETGKTQKAAKAGGGMVRKLAIGAGTFVLGCVFSGAAAIACAVLWFLLAVWTGYEIGYVAWGLGALAGLAMYGGYRRKNTRAGLVAAGMSALGIVAAKIMVFAFVVHAVFTGDTSDPQLKRDYVALQRTEEILRGRNAFTQDDREAQWDSASAEAERSVGRMSDSEVEQKWAEYQEKDERENAFADETGAKRARLARHRARLRARGEGLSPYSEQEDRYFNEEFSKLRSSDEATLGSETERLDAWEKGEVWANPDDVRTHLIYLRIDERMAEEHRDSDDEWEYPQGREWKRLHQEISAEVDAMGPEEQVALGKRIAQEQKDESMRSALAWHRADVLGKREGLYYGDDRWDVLREEQRAAVDQISSEELTAEHAKLQQWNDGGMWQDAEHVRDRLIYEYANQRIADHREAQGDGDLDEAFPTAHDWKRIHSESVRQAEAVPPEERVSTIQRIEAEQSARWSQKLQQRQSDEAREVLASAFTIFFKTMFGPMDLLFFGLAIFTAFKVASGSEAEA